MPRGAFVTIDGTLETPPYAQIFGQLRGLIEGGSLSAGDPLPTVRQLAADLRIAPNTVARAYADLADAGWVVSEGRRGTRVAEAVPRVDSRARGHALHEDVARFVTSLSHRGFSVDEIAAALERARRAL